MSSSAAFYFILGTPGSGRRGIVLDLIENGVAPTDPALVLLADSEPADPVDEKFAARDNVEVRRWSWNGAELPDVKNLPATGAVFFFADSRGDPMTQLELLKPWLAARQTELSRIFTVVDCQLAEKQAPLAAWFDACIYFSDVVFLTKREGVANKWLSAFIRRYEDLFYPAHFIQVKKGGLANPAIVLDPTPRRVAQYFEEFEDLSGIEIETDDEEEDAEVDEDAPKPEPYFERNRSGRRVKELPD
ncbi:MAG TPA: hypothetical protein VK477_01655, partial [Acidobacteriota bacterium]|nr:hypothetical protein [Acidobacteriota bacterium]